MWSNKRRITLSTPVRTFASIKSLLRTHRAASCSSRASRVLFLSELILNDMKDDSFLADKAVRRRTKESHVLIWTARSALEAAIIS